MSNFADKILFLPERASTFAEKVDHLHYFVVGVTMAVVDRAWAWRLIFMFFRYRRRVPEPDTPSTWCPTWLTEFLFVSVPLVFFLALVRHRLPRLRLAAPRRPRTRWTST